LSLGRQRAESLSHHSRDSPTNTPAPPISSTREHSALRGRALTTAGHSNSRSHTPVAAVPKLPGAHEAPALERKPSGSYGHHRQTSIVHGNIQHSRNHSFASPSTSPITPQTIAEVVGQHGVDALIMGQNDMGPRTINNGPETISNGHSPSASASTLINDIHSLAPRRLERVQSTGGRLKTPSHASSHSRGQHSEVRTVGEYALHHLFNSVCLCIFVLCIHLTCCSSLPWRTKKLPNVSMLHNNMKLEQNQCVVKALIQLLINSLLLLAILQDRNPNL
jgi:hypothetical protein